MIKIKEYLSSRWRAYRVVFNDTTSESRTVLEDLAKFCRANQTTFHPDPRVHAVAEGRREVWLRIMEHLNLDQEEFIQRLTPNERD